MRSITDSLNDNDYLVSGFDASAFAAYNVYDIFENKYRTITEDSIVWINTNKKI